MDADGRKGGYDAALLRSVCDACTVPVIASSGTGAPRHFVDAFAETRVEAALAAGIFHREEVAISAVKGALRDAEIAVRR